MSTMQIFYDQLFSPQNEDEGYFYALVRLTRISLAQAENLRSSITWTIWNASSA